MYHRKLRKPDLAVMPCLFARKAEIGEHMEAGTARFFNHLIDMQKCTCVVAGAFHTVYDVAKEAWLYAPVPTVWLKISSKSKSALSWM